MNGCKVGVLGPHGKLGCELVGLGYSPILCDITDKKSIMSALSLCEYDVIVNCAAKTNLDQLENDEDMAFAVNFRGACNIRNIFNGWMIQISTAYVYGDDEQIPHTEEDENFNPLSVYACSKLAADIYLMSMMNKTTIIRTTGLFGSKHDNDPVNQVMKGNVQDAPINLFSNYMSVPILAANIKYIIDHGLFIAEIVNLVHGDYCNRLEFYQLLHRYATINNESLKGSRILEKTWEKSDCAERPLHCQLSTEKAKKNGLPLGSLTYGIYNAINRLSQL